MASLSCSPDGRCSNVNVNGLNITYVVLSIPKNISFLTCFLAGRLQSMARRPIRATTWPCLGALPRCLEPVTQHRGLRMYQDLKEITRAAVAPKNEAEDIISSFLTARGVIMPA